MAELAESIGRWVSCEIARVSREPFGELRIDGERLGRDPDRHETIEVGAGLASGTAR